MRQTAAKTLLSGALKKKTTQLSNQGSQQERTVLLKPVPDTTGPWKKEKMACSNVGTIGVNLFKVVLKCNRQQN